MSNLPNNSLNPEILHDKLQEGLQAGHFPAAAMAVVTGDSLLFLETTGHFSPAPLSPVPDEHSLFDLASLTKVIVTTTLTAQLYEEGNLKLDMPWTSFPGSPTIRTLLTHCAGYPAGFPFHTLPRGTNWLNYVQLEYQPQTKSVYSDISMLILGKILQNITDTPLDVLAHERIFAPLQMKETCFNPPADWRRRCIPTEQKPGYSALIQGAVHDENTRWLGGIAPHAGLFSSLHDLCIFAQEILNGAPRLFKCPDTLKLFTTRCNLVANSSRSLGWDCASPDNSSGTSISSSGFGHTGFTGTSIWFDPEKKRAVILLTNSVCPHRENKFHGFFPWRREVNSLAFE